MTSGLTAGAGSAGSADGQAGSAADRSERLAAGDPRAPARSGPTEFSRWPGWRELAARHVRVMAVLAVLAVIGATVLVLRARTWPEAVGLPTPSWTPAPSPAPTAQASPALMTVHVLGAVHQPGLVELPTGSRVWDALAAAGGLTDQADPAELNLAGPLWDGCQIIVGTRSEPRGEVRGGLSGGSVEPGLAGGATSGTIDLNSATAQQLESLPGIGPVTAAAILAWRSQHGRFTTVAELQEVDGIGPKTYAQLVPYVRV